MRRGPSHRRLGENPSPREFTSADEAMAYLRTKFGQHANAMVHAGDLGLQLSEVAVALDAAHWLFGGHGIATKKTITRTTAFKLPKTQHTETLEALVGFVSIGGEVLALAESLRDRVRTLDRGGWSSVVSRELTHRKRVFLGTILLLAEHLAVQVTARDLDALSIVTGDRPSSEELRLPKFDAGARRTRLTDLRDQRPKAFDRLRKEAGIPDGPDEIERLVDAERIAHFRIREKAARYRETEQRLDAWTKLRRETSAKTLPVLKKLLATGVRRANR